MSEAKVLPIKPSSFAGQVWQTLSKVDCSAHVERLKTRLLAADGREC